MNNLDDKLCSQAFRVDPFGKNLEKIPKNRSRDFLRDRTSPMVVLARNWISTTSIGLWDDLTFMSAHRHFILRENRAMDVVRLRRSSE